MFHGAVNYLKAVLKSAKTIYNTTLTFLWCGGGMDGAAHCAVCRSRGSVSAL